MSHRIMAIYESGVLRPLSPLELAENSRVEIDIRRVDVVADQVAHRDLVRQALIDAGLSVSELAIGIQSPPLSGERREELARLFSADRPLSELINEDREGR